MRHICVCVCLHAVHVRMCSVNAHIISVNRRRNFAHSPMRRADLAPTSLRTCALDLTCNVIEEIKSRSMSNKTQQLTQAKDNIMHRYSRFCIACAGIQFIVSQFA